MSSRTDQLPRIFQANLGRLADRVILPGLHALPLHASLETGAAPTLDAFLDRAAAQVDNYTANEAAKAYTLTLAGVFERQLSLLASAIHAEGLADMSRMNGIESLLAGCADQTGINLDHDGLGADLIQMFVVANVVRQGEGWSCKRLRTMAPELWSDEDSDYLDLLPGEAKASEAVRIRPLDILRYLRATMRFWGLTDPLPMAVIDPPYPRDS